MPALDLSNWLNGEVTAEQMKGKVVLVDFYATWCGPCLAAIPHNNDLWKKYKDLGLVIVGVCTGSEQEQMAKIVRDKKMEYPTARDLDLKSQKAWGVHYYPTYAVIDRKGVVRSLGFWRGRVESMIKKLLQEEVETAQAKS